MIAYLQLLIKLLAPPVKCETYELNISICGANDSVLCVKSTQELRFILGRYVFMLL